MFGNMCGKVKVDNNKWWLNPSFDIDGKIDVNQRKALIRNYIHSKLVLIKVNRGKLKLIEGTVGKNKIYWGKSR